MSHADTHSDSDARLAELRKSIEQKKKELHDLEEQERIEHERREKERAERAKRLLEEQSHAQHPTTIPATTSTTTQPSSTPSTTTPSTTTTTTTTTQPSTTTTPPSKELTEEEKEIAEATRIRREVRARAARENAEKQKLIEEHRHEEERRRAARCEEERREKERRDHEAIAALHDHEREKAREMPEQEHWEKLKRIFDEREKKEAAQQVNQLVEPEWYKGDFAWFCEDDKQIILEQHPNFKYGQTAEKLRSDWLHLPANLKKLYEEKAQHDFARYSEQRKKYDEKAGLGLKIMEHHK